MKIKGVSIWIWLLGMVVITATAVIGVPRAKAALADAARPKPLEMVKEDLWRHRYDYEVRGQIYNPRNEPVRNVRISYEVWGKWKGKKGHGTIIEETGGLVEDRIKYIPANGTVDFTAIGTAPTMTEESGIVPSPLKAKIEEGAEMD